MPFYIFAWIGALSSGLTVVTAKLTSKHSIANPWLFAGLLGIASFVFTLIPALYFHAGFPKSWSPIIFAALFYTLWIFATYALDVSNLAPLFNFKVVFAVLLGSILFKESLTQYQLLLVGVIIVAGVFTSLDEKFNLRSFFQKANGLVILAMFILVLSNIFIKLSLQTNDLWTNNLWVSIFNLAFLLPTIPFFYNDLKKLNVRQCAPVGVMGAFRSITEMSSNIAYGVNLTITTLIMNIPFSMIIAFIFSVFAPKLLEKHTKKVYAIRFASVSIMIYAAMQLMK